VASCLATVALGGQSIGVDPAALLKPLGEQWTSYSGDYPPPL
jgi:hypothetical protein